MYDWEYLYACFIVDANAWYFLKTSYRSFARNEDAIRVHTRRCLEFCKSSLLGEKHKTCPKVSLPAQFVVVQPIPSMPYGAPAAARCIVIFRQFTYLKPEQTISVVNPFLRRCTPFVQCYTFFSVHSGHVWNYSHRLRSHKASVRFMRHPYDNNTRVVWSACMLSFRAQSLNLLSRSLTAPTNLWPLLINEWRMLKSCEYASRSARINPRPSHHRSEYKKGSGVSFNIIKILFIASLVQLSVTFPGLPATVSMILSTAKHAHFDFAISRRSQTS